MNEGVLLRVPEDVLLDDTVGVLDRDGVAEDDADIVDVAEPPNVIVGVFDGVTEEVLLGVTLGVLVLEVVLVGDTLEVLVLEVVLVGDTLELLVIVDVAEPPNVIVGVFDDVLDGVTEEVALGVRLGLVVLVGDTLGVLDLDGVTEDVLLDDTVGLLDLDGVTEDVVVGVVLELFVVEGVTVGDADNVVVDEPHTVIVPVFDDDTVTLLV